MIKKYRLTDKPRNFSMNIGNSLKYLYSLSLKELRRRQTLNEQQKIIAFQHNNKEALESLELMEVLLIQAVDIVGFPQN